MYTVAKKYVHYKTMVAKSKLIVILHNVITLINIPN